MVEWMKEKCLYILIKRKIIHFYLQIEQLHELKYAVEYIIYLFSWYSLQRQDIVILQVHNVIVFRANK